MCSIARSTVTLAAIILGALALAMKPVRAETWPERTVRLVIPLPPGSPSDVALRRLAERLSQRWRQAVIVENKQGADGIPAVSALLSAHDGHTLLFSFPGIITINPLLHETLPYDPAKDLVPIVPVLDNFIAFAAATSLGVATLSDLVAAARTNPGKINWSALPGVPNYVFLALQRSANIEAVRVGYRDFAPAYQDLHQGRLQVVVAGITNFIPHREAGTAKILALINRERTALAPDVPTAAEAGYPELTFDSPVGLYGPRDMPAALVERVSADVRAIAGEPEFRAKLVSGGVAPRTGTSSEFAAAIEDQRAKIAAIHRSSVAKQ